MCAKPVTEDQSLSLQPLHRVWIVPREKACQVPELVGLDNHHLVGDIEQAGLPVRPVGCVVSLPGGRAVEFPDPGRVEVRGVHGDRSPREERVKNREASFHQVHRLVVIRQVDSVEQMGAVPRVGHDRRRPSLLPAQVCGNLRCPYDCCLVLLVGRRDAARPDRVQVDGEPPPPDHVGIAGSRVLPAKIHLHPVRPPGEQRGIDRVQRDIDAGDLRQRVQVCCLLGQHIEFVKITAVDQVIGQGPEFDDSAVREEGFKRPLNLPAHTGPSWQSGTRGKSGAETASPRATRWKLTSGMMKCPDRV